MDSLRITLIVLGVALIALVYGWDRIKRRKNPNRYARWGVSDDDTETHIVGRNSGDPETDSQLVSTAYDSDAHYENPYDDEVYSNQLENEFGDEKNEFNVDNNDAWEPEISDNLEEELVTEDIEPDLDSDPEINDNAIEDITSELEALEEMISQDPEQTKIDLGDLDIPLEPEPVSVEPEKIIAVHVLVREGSSFSGADILSKLTELNLQHGDRGIFHRYDTNGKTIFSLANAVEPGVFDIAAMDEMSTPALLFILSLPSTIPALEAYDSMLDAARSLTDSLNGRLCDETRSVLTRQAIDELRAELTAL